MRNKRIRVCLFTDTLGDVNGVSRFICNVAAAAEMTGRDLRVFTSTRFDVPRRANIRNFDPIVAGAMPGYPQLELALPPVPAMLRAVRDASPDAIHISTPGPVGLVGLAAARRLRIPVLGVYHTDFPAYIERLFNDEAFTWLSAVSMRIVYGRFAKVFTRSRDYSLRLHALGVPQDRLIRLRPGIDTTAFNPRYDRRGEREFWLRLGLPPAAAGSPKVLYAGRISIEKDLPLLTEAWRRVRAAFRMAPGDSSGLQQEGYERAHAAGRGEESRSRSRGAAATMLREPVWPWRAGGDLPVAPPQLIVVGDGPYRAQMERELCGPDVHFPGFRRGDELSAIYASSDLFIFPSTTDTLGQVVMEAQASGLPVLVSDRGGPCEVVDDGITGRVLPAGQAAAWSSAILELLGDSPARIAMGAAAHEAMRPMSISHSFEHFWHEHERVIKERQSGDGLEAT